MIKAMNVLIIRRVSMKAKENSRIQRPSKPEREGGKNGFSDLPLLLLGFWTLGFRHALHASFLFVTFSEPNTRPIQTRKISEKTKGYRRNGIQRVMAL